MQLIDARVYRALLVAMLYSSCLRRLDLTLVSVDAAAALPWCAGHLECCGQPRPGLQACMTLESGLVLDWNRVVDLKSWIWIWTRTWYTSDAL